MADTNSSSPHWEDVGHTTRTQYIQGARADVRMSEAGPSSEAGCATPEGARADAATPIRTGDTMHMHSVADTARRRVRGSQKSSKKRQREAGSRALAEEAEAVEAQRARAEPHPDA